MLARLSLYFCSGISQSLTRSERGRFLFSMVAEMFLKLGDSARNEYATVCCESGGAPRSIVRAGDILTRRGMPPAFFSVRGKGQ